MERNLNKFNIKNLADHLAGWLGEGYEIVVTFTNNGAQVKCKTPSGKEFYPDARESIGLEIAEALCFAIDDDEEWGKEN